MARQTQFSPGKIIAMTLGVLTAISLIFGAAYQLDNRFMSTEAGHRLDGKITLVSERLEGKILTDRWWQVDRYLRGVIRRTGRDCTKGPQRDIDQCLHLIRQRFVIEQDMKKAGVPTPSRRR